MQARNAIVVTKLGKYTSTCLENVDGLKRTKDSLTPASIFITEVGKIYVPLTASTSSEQE